MANMLCIQKSERTPLRKLPLLPRFAVTVDVAGLKLTYKQVPLLETLLNARERGFSVENLLRVAQEALDEVAIPAAQAAKRTAAKVAKAPKAAAAKAAKAPLAAVRELNPKRKGAAAKAAPAPEA